MVVSKARAGLLLTAAVCVSVAACGGGGSSGTATGGGATTPGQKGGTLYILNLGPHNGLDPQASYVGVDLEFAARAYARSLITWSVGRRQQAGPGPGDRHRAESDGGKTWKFTLVDTAKWQDGQKVTCDDVKYGISRTFATDVISNGPTSSLASSTSRQTPTAPRSIRGPTRTRAWRTSTRPSPVRARR